ncbi:MAG: carboxypeptidase-like regulatory domain-containing protein [Flavobacteriaceae bacterium]|nr:MAG: carboxypeptidase-like regulatory domain-containing protein [Flavobacteriaceae bacterium]
MKTRIIIILIFLCQFSQSQNVIVVDSLTNKPIPFVNIYLSNNNGTFTNENGYFELNRKLKDSIKFSHLGYSELTVLASDIKDTIVLSPNAVILKEVNITNGKKIIKYIDFPKKKSHYGSFPVISKSEIITFLIPSNENSDSFISNLNFKFEKKKYMENQSNLRTAFRINIYNSLDEKIDNKIFSSETFIVDATKKESIDVDLNDYNIQFSKEGIFISIEVIGDIDNEGNITNLKSTLRPVLTSNTTQDYSAKTYIKYIFDKKMILNPINEILEKGSGDKINRNLSFGITLIK